MKRMKRLPSNAPTGTMMTGDPDEIMIDPFGMYTGVPKDEADQPVQDADDL